MARATPQPSVTTGCVSCVSGDGIDGGPVWWTDPYTAWAAKKKLEKGQKRKAESAAPLDADVEARLKALRGESGPDAWAAANGVSVSEGSATLDPDVEARLAMLRGGGGGGGSSSGAEKGVSMTTKGYDSD